MDSCNAIELQDFIKEWRSLAKIGGVPFFAFATLRQALSTQVSFFNFCHLVFSDCRFEQVPAHMSTREIEKQLLVPWSRDNDPQCLFLARGERTFGERPASCCGMHSDEGLARLPAMKRGIQAERTHVNQPAQQHSKPQMEVLRNNLTRAECSNVCSVLQESMDWIGVLDHCNEETFPMLTQMTRNNASLASELVRAWPGNCQRTKRLLQLQSVSKATMEQLKRKSQMDVKLCRQASRELLVGERPELQSMQSPCQVSFSVCHCRL